MRWLFAVLYLGCLSLLPLRLRRRHALRVRQTEEFLLLLKRIRREISCFSRPLPEIVRAADLPALSAAGFFDRENGGDPLVSFLCASPALLISPEAKELLGSFFSAAGASMKAEEIGACEYAIGRLDELLTREKTEGANRLRLHSTLIFTGGLLFLLLVV